MVRTWSQELKYVRTGLDAQKSSQTNLNKNKETTAGTLYFPVHANLIERRFSRVRIDVSDGFLKRTRTKVIVSS